jgi:hypothetical protein
MSDDLTYSRATAWANNQGYLKEHQPISADQWNSSYETVLSNSAQWGDNTGDEEVNSFVYDNSATINDVNTSYIQNSGTFLTSHQVIPSAKWEDASDVVQSNSAQWSENTGDEEVNNAVYNNSAKWNEIGVYEQNSATYLTAHQDISNKLDTTAFSTVSGTFLTAHQDLSNYATTGDLNTASGILSGAIEYLSGNAGKTYTGISPIVVNNTTNEISADSQDITFGEGLDFTNGVLTVTGAGTTYTGDAQGALDEVYANSGVWLTAHQPISANEWNSVYDTVESNSGSWAGGGSIDTIPVVAISPLVTGFSGESAYLGIESTALNLSSYVPVSSLTYNGNYLTGVSGKQISSYYTYSAYTARNANNANTANRSYRDGNGNEITSYYQPKLTIAGDAGTITAINGSAVGANIPEGWELVAGQGIEIVDDAENNQTTISVTAAGGNPEVNNYVQTNSAIIDDTIGYTQTNSANIEEISAYIQSNSANIDNVSSNYVILSAQYDELKQSYDALSSLFATYSGQWLLPNQGE